MSDEMKADKISPETREAKKNNAVYEAEQRTIQILDILKNYSDENVSITQAEILKKMVDTKDPKVASSKSRNTVAKSIKRIIDYINPVMYDANDEEYRIKYSGYDSEEMPSSITNLSYVHDFNNKELDQLMNAVNFDRSLSKDEKRNLMKKLQATASIYYDSPFYDARTGRMMFHEYAIHSRLDKIEEGFKYENNLSDNIKIIQSAINEKVKIIFTFNRYDRDKALVPVKTKRADGKHVLSPYHIVVYQEFYFLLGAFDGATSASIYRIDLMTDVETFHNSDGDIEKIWPIRNVDGLLVDNKWNPEKFMREHLYMHYDEPQNFKLKIKSDDYTLIHDWFGDYYRGRPSDEEGYDIVSVKCTAKGMERFARQYEDRVKVIE